MAKTPATLVRSWSSTTTKPRSSTFTPALSRPIPWELGTRPTADRTYSTFSSWAFPLASLKVTFTPSFWMSAFSKRADVWMSMPRFL